MAKYIITRACGHQEEVDVVGRSSDRPRKLEWLATKECWECGKMRISEERKEHSIRSKAEAEDRELPTLSGTEKQVAWAESLRMDFISWVETETGKYEALRLCLISLGKTRIELEQSDRESTRNLRDRLFDTIAGYVADYMLAKTDAKWWIDNRDYYLQRLFPFGGSGDRKLRDLVEAVIAGEDSEGAEIVAEINQNIDADSKGQPVILHPGATERFGIVALSITEGSIMAHFPEKNDALRIILKRLGFRWHGAWMRSLDGRGLASALAETGSLLLANKFSVRVPEQSDADNIVDKNFVPTTGRRLIVYNGQIAFDWDRCVEDLREMVRRVRSARYDTQYKVMTVSRDAVNEAIDFAESHGFYVSESVREIAKARGVEILAQRVVAIDPVKVGHGDGPVPAELPVPATVEVHPDLVDAE